MQKTTGGESIEAGRYICYWADGGLGTGVQVGGKVS